MSKFVKLTTVAAIVLGLAGLGTAQGNTGALTRSQVQAELHAARVSGQMAMHGEDSGSAWLSRQPSAAGGATHAAEPPAIAAALAAALIREDSGSAYLSANAPRSTLTRSQVRAEVEAARKSGELNAMVGEDSGSAFLARQRSWAAALYAGPNIGTPRHEAQSPAAG